MTASDLLEAAARALSTWDQEMWDIQVAKESTSVLICRKQAELALGSLGIPLDRLALLASGEAWIAPRDLTNEAALAVMSVVAAWQANEIAEIGKGYDTSKLDPEMAALDRGYQRGLLAYSGEEFRVIWAAMRDRYLTPDEPDEAAKG